MSSDNEQVSEVKEKRVQRKRCPQCGQLMKKPSSGSEKPKRAPSKYNLFCKEHCKDEDVVSLKPTDRTRKLAEKWRVHKEKLASGSKQE